MAMHTILLGQAATLTVASHPQGSETVASFCDHDAILADITRVVRPAHWAVSQRGLEYLACEEITEIDPAKHRAYLTALTHWIAASAGLSADLVASRARLADQFVPEVHFTA